MLETKQRRRDQLSIIASMLEITHESVLKTQIMYRANLSFLQLNDYLAVLFHNGLIFQSNVDGKEVYNITAKGLGFLKRYRELQNMINKNSEI